MRATFISLTIILSSCSGWYGNQEEAYMQECEKNMANTLRSSAQDHKAKDVCACSLEKVKEKWSYDEFTQVSESEEVKEIMQDCIYSETEIKE